MSVSAADEGATLEVRDTGPGIPDPDKCRVTERFYRLDGARGTAGNGLGLSLVAAVAERHEARLEFADEQPGADRPTAPALGFRDSARRRGRRIVVSCPRFILGRSA